MTAQYNKVGEGTPELAQNFGKDLVSVAISPGGYFAPVSQTGDVDLRWAVRDQSEDVIYMGAALVRKGKVHFYDRYPMGGGPFRVSDFTSPDFRKRAELISENIERLLQE